MYSNTKVVPPPLPLSCRHIHSSPALERGGGGRSKEDNGKKGEKKPQGESALLFYTPTLEKINSVSVVDAAGRRSFCNNERHYSAVLGVTTKHCKRFPKEKDLHYQFNFRT